MKTERYCGPRTLLGEAHMHQLAPLTAEEKTRLEDSPEFRPWIIKRYTYWTVYLTVRDQGLPGRMHVWLNRHVDCMGYEELLLDEQIEFSKTIVPRIRHAVSEIGPYLRLNIEWLGNEIEGHRGHGHFHVTPRYSEPFECNGRGYEDLFPNKRRSTPKLALSHDELAYIRDVLKTKF